EYQPSRYHRCGTELNCEIGDRAARRRHARHTEQLVARARWSHNPAARSVHFELVLAGRHCQSERAVRSHATAEHTEVANLVRDTPDLDASALSRLPLGIEDCSAYDARHRVDEHDFNTGYGLGTLDPNRLRFGERNGTWIV